jgi:hypothetical protein
MFDLIVPNVSSHGNEYESAKATAYMAWEGHCRTLFGNVRAEIVSSNYSLVCVSCRRVVSHLTLFSARPRFRDLIVKLVATTDGVIMGHSRDFSASAEAQRTQSRMSPVTLAWSVSQRASRSINIQATIECVTSFLLLNLFLISYDRVGQSREWILFSTRYRIAQLGYSAHIGYWHRLGSSEVFAGQTLANCVEVIRSDIVGVWNLPDMDRVCLFFPVVIAVLCLGRSVLVKQGVRSWYFSSYPGSK